MASEERQNWYDYLVALPIFTEFGEHEQEELTDNRSRNVLAHRDGEIYIWNSCKKCVHTTNLKNILAYFNGEMFQCPVQIFLCATSPYFIIHTLTFSITGRFLALIGDNGVAVLDLPGRWGRYAEFEGGKTFINCSTSTLDGRFYSTHPHIKVLQAKWHPASPLDVHLVVLTSDNKIRIYNVTEPDSPSSIIPVGQPTFSQTLSTSSSQNSFAAAFGEVAVAFDFGPPAQDSYLVREDEETSTDSTHPVFLVRENGDVYHLLFHLTNQRIKPKLIGPLTIHPAADDNYGLDACAIECIHSSPPVLVIATARGKLYHCIVLEKGDEEESTGEIESGASIKETDTSQRHLQELALFVYECIELKLSLLPGDSEDESEESPETGEESDDSYPVVILKEDTNNSRYHCCHPLGVHSISLPWLHSLDIYSKTDQSPIEEFDTSKCSVIHHMLCTRPVPKAPPNPLLGVCVVSDPLLTPTLLCLTQQMECIPRPLSLINVHYSLPPIDKDNSVPQTESPIRKLNSSTSTPGFAGHIKNILTHSTSTPLLRAGAKASSLSQEDLFRLLTNSIQTYRREYVQKMQLAKAEMEKRMHILTRQKQKQTQDLQMLRQSQLNAYQKAENIAEKWCWVEGSQENLVERVEKLMSLIQIRIPVLSDAEKQMKNDLVNIHKDMKEIARQLEQVKRKQAYHNKLIQETQGNISSIVLNEAQKTNLRTLLKKESASIDDLAQQVKNLKIQVGI